MDINGAFEIVMQKINTWFNELVSMLPNLLLAAVIIVTGVFISKIVKKYAEKYMEKISSNTTLNSLFSSIIYVLMIGLTIFSALTVLELDKAVTSILAGAGIFGLAIAFAFQDIASNFISGIFISFRKPIRINDVVKVKNYLGTVKEINLRDTVLHTFQGQIVIIPNKDVFQNPIENYTVLGRRRFDLDIGVSYGEDLEKVKEVALAAVDGIKELCEGEETTVFFNAFGDSSINFTMRLWVDTSEQAAWLTAGSEAIIRIKKAFDKNNISIPFPIRTLDFGIKGGVPLSEMPVSIKEEKN